jgi:hypothetical protein
LEADACERRTLHVEEHPLKMNAALKRYEHYRHLLKVYKPIEIWGFVRQRGRHFVRGLKAKTFGTSISDHAFQKALIPELSKPEVYLAHFGQRKQSRFFVDPSKKDEILSTIRMVASQTIAATIHAADVICEHCFDLLGSRHINLNWPIDWHRDFKSGFRWNPKRYYADIRPAPYPGGYDLKVPWELSRCQHFVWLGQAYWLTGDEKYTREFRAEIEDWITQNPPEFGVNWACSMDIAIRAVNWLWGYAFFQSSPVLDDDFRWRFAKSLLSHGRHIMANLERTATFTGNHYLSDVVGLVYLGILLPEFKESRTWRDFGLKELEHEMFKQVYPDGGNFEASTSYHRLGTELFLSATLLGRLNGFKFSPAYMERLEKMLEFIFQITKPDGTVPIIGDQDNGRLHRLRVWENLDLEWKDFRYLLALGCVLFDRPEWGKAAGDQWEEAIWFYGKQALSAYERISRYALSPTGSVQFKDTGIYVMRADDIYTAVDIGPVGQNGRGGHAHNDSLSFELFASGQTWIQDPGTYVYTADYEARNLFRSTAFHNTLSMPGYEQNSYDAMNLFILKSESTSQVLSWRAEPDSDAWLTGEVQRFKAPNVIHRRSFHLCRENRALLLTDVVRNAQPVCELLFHFAPGLDFELVEEPYPGLRLINSKGIMAWIFSISTGRAKLKHFEGWISESYGRRVPAWVASIRLESIVEHKTVVLLPGDTAISSRIENVINDEDHHH